MTFLRALGLIMQARLSLAVSKPPQIAATQSEDSKPKAQAEAVRHYHTETHRLDRMAPIVAKFQSRFFWASAILECSSIAYHVFYDGITSILDFSDITPLFVIALVLGVSGALVRLECFKALGPMFTFTLTIQPEHRLVQHGPYAYVRHPAYTSGNLMILGASLAHLVCPESLTRQYLGPALSYAFCGTLWTWLTISAMSRAVAEDEEMHREFGKEWEEYASRVGWWFLPGII